MTPLRQAARPARRRLTGTLLALLLLAPAAAAPSLAAAPADTLYGLKGTNTLIVFSSATPGTIDQTTPITGLPVGTTLLSIDVRPATGQLFGIGITGTAGTAFGRLYTLNPATGAATAVGATPFYTTLTATAQFSMDFNPASDRLRVVNNLDLNLRVNPNTGLLTGHDPDLNRPSNNPYIASLAANRQQAGVGSTLYGIDYFLDELVMIGGVNGTPSANGGLVSPVGPLGLTIQSSDIGLDIGADGRAYASFRAGGSFGLYTINLATGAATLIGAIDTGVVAIIDIAIKMHFDLYQPLVLR